VTTKTKLKQVIKAFNIVPFLKKRNLKKRKNLLLKICYVSLAKGKEGREKRS